MSEGRERNIPRALRPLLNRGTPHHDFLCQRGAAPHRAPRACVWAAGGERAPGVQGGGRRLRLAELAEHSVDRVERGVDLFTDLNNDDQ